jgi:hypothetical protein
MPSFVQKLASKAAKKAVNKIVDRAVGGLVEGIFGRRSSGPGRVFTFGGTQKDMRFAANPNLLQYREIFHDQLTTEWSFHTPNRSLWYLEIDRMPVKVLESDTMKTFESVTVNSRSNAISDVYDKNNNAYLKIVQPEGPLGSPRSKMMHNPKNTQNTGCLFAQGVNIPQEGMTFTRAEVGNSGGLIPGLVAQPRNTFNPLSVEFRETNISFVDTVLRPWVVMASHLGLVARSDGDNLNIKSDITITQLAVNGRDQPPVIRKQFRFYNCVPFQINQQQMTYDTDGGSMNPIDTQWIFSHYHVSIDPTGVHQNESGSDMTGFGTSDTNRRSPFALPSTLDGAIDTARSALS